MKIGAFDLIVFTEICSLQTAHYETRQTTIPQAPTTATKKVDFLVKRLVVHMFAAGNAR